MPPVTADAIADCVLAAFEALTAKCKPRSLPNGRKEWTILAGVVLSKDKPTPTLTCVSLATGMKCLPRSKLAGAKGNVLHDWHAEILALRGFNRWLVDECAELARLGRESRHEWLRWRRTRSRSARSDIARGSSREDELQRDVDGVQSGQQHMQEYEDQTAAANEEAIDDDCEGSQPFALQPEVKIHLYISSAPCGDASMELTMSSQEDSTPWTTAPPTDRMPGRSNFDLLGVVRRKPARPDAPVTWSKSCSDKLAIKQATSVLSGVVAADEGLGLVWPKDCYLSSLVLPKDEIAPEAIERCFGHGPTGRLHSLAGKKWQGGYAFTPFTVMHTSRIFGYAKPQASPSATQAEPTTSETTVASNISALLAPKWLEVLINGVLQGRKQSDPKGASSVSRRRIWEDVRAVRNLVRLPTTITPTITPASTGTITGTVTGKITATNTATNTARNISTTTPSVTAPEDATAGMASSDADATPETYGIMKSGPALADRRAVKEDVWVSALQGWKKNVGDEGWRL